MGSCLTPQVSPDSRTEVKLQLRKLLVAHSRLVVQSCDLLFLICYTAYAFTNTLFNPFDSYRWLYIAVGQFTLTSITATYLIASRLVWHWGLGRMVDARDRNSTLKMTLATLILAGGMPIACALSGWLPVQGHGGKFLMRAASLLVHVLTLATAYISLRVLLRSQKGLNAKLLACYLHVLLLTAAYLQAQCRFTFHLYMTNVLPELLLTPPVYFLVSVTSGIAVSIGCLIVVYAFPGRGPDRG